MSEIIERYKVMSWNAEDGRVAWSWYSLQAYRIAELASDDMRKVLRLLNRRAAIILELRAELGTAQADVARLERELQEARAEVFGVPIVGTLDAKTRLPRPETPDDWFGGAA